MFHQLLLFSLLVARRVLCCLQSVASPTDEDGYNCFWILVQDQLAESMPNHSESEGLNENRSNGSSRYFNLPSYKLAEQQTECPFISCKGFAGRDAKFCSHVDVCISSNLSAAGPPPANSLRGVCSLQSLLVTVGQVLHCGHPVQAQHLS